MKKTGGILGIVGGIFGIFAALATLFLGGLGSAFQANGASTVVSLGWGGSVLSLLSIICGAIVFAKPKGAGIALVVTSIAGMIGGGMLVAVCMVLSLIGGTLAIISAKKQTPVTTLSGDTHQANANSSPDKTVRKKISPWTWGSAAVFIVLIAIGASPDHKPVAPVAEASAPVAPEAELDPLAKLAQAPVAGIQPVGPLADIFAVGGQYTDLQRENTLKEIKGRIVSWTLPVYEVKRDGNGYKIQTNAGRGHGYVGTFISITPRNEQDRQIIEALKTGESVSFRGVIADTFMRHIVIKPAILEHQNITAPEASAPPQAPVATGYTVETGTYTGTVMLSADLDYSLMSVEVPDANHIAVYFRNDASVARAILTACPNGQLCEVSGTYRVGAAPANAPKISSVQDAEWISVTLAKAVTAL